MANVLHFKPSRAEAADEDLMGAVVHGDLDAFEILVKRHQNRVYRMAARMLGSEDDAWDVSQEIFIKVYNARASYVSNAKFTTWLYRIANNAVIDKIRQYKRNQQVQSMTDMIHEPESTDFGSHKSLALREVSGQMGKALSALSERQRGMVVLKYYEGFSVKEIADVFECAQGTVKATLFQAVQHLRTGLAGSGIVNAEVSS